METNTRFKKLSKLFFILGAAAVFACLAGTASDAAQIDGDRALEIALAHAGMTRADALHIEVELDREHGMAVYEVEFRSRDGSKFEYDIDAATGKILKQKRAVVTVPTGGTYISEERALEIALAHAGVAKADAAAARVKLEGRKNHTKYEVEFRTAGSKHEYEIDAVSGAIIEWEVKHY